jgi:hypothetical protein
MFGKMFVTIHNHVQRKASSSVAIHGFKIADSGEPGSLSAADKLMRLGPDGHLHVGDDFHVFGNVVFEGSVGIGATSGGGAVTLNQLASDVAALDLKSVRFKKYDPIVATDGQTSFALTVGGQPETYQMGQNRLLVFSGSVLAEGDYTEQDNQHILFTTGREEGEVVQVIEMQVGSDDGSTVVDDSPNQTFMQGETPVGVVDSTDGFDGNGVFTVSQTVFPTPAPRIFISGAIELPSDLWTRVGKTFTIADGHKPQVGESISIFYSRTP